LCKSKQFAHIFYSQYDEMKRKKSAEIIQYKDTQRHTSIITKKYFFTKNKKHLEKFTIFAK